MLARVLNLFNRGTEIIIVILGFLLEVRKGGFKLGMEVVGVGFELCNVETDFCKESKFQ